MNIKECPERNGQYPKRCLRYWFSLKYRDPISPAATNPESLTLLVLSQSDSGVTAL